MMRRRADSKLRHLRKNMKIELSMKCTKGTKNNTMTLSAAIKMQRPPSINTGTTLRTKSTMITRKVKPRCLIDTIKNVMKPKRILKFNSAPKLRKPQNSLI